MAEKIYVSQKSVSNWEFNRTYLDLESLIRLAKLFGLSLNNMLLEDSNIVKAIKEKAELKVIRNYSMAPLITDMALVILLLGQRWWGSFSPAAILMIVIGMLSNLVCLLYFNDKYVKIWKKSASLTKWRRVAFIVVGLFLEKFGIKIILFENGLTKSSADLLLRV